MKTDIAIVGGGIVGLATAYKLALRYPDKRIAVLEKETKLAQHQTGRNSGVIHSGIYYKPGSLKATTCYDGRKQLVEFCQENGIAFDICGKVIVALDEKELPSLDRIYDRGQKNGINCEMIDGGRVRELEPHVAGIKGIHVHDTGIVDYPGFCEKIADILRARGHSILLGAKVNAIKQDDSSVHVETTSESVTASYLINCAGLYADRIAELDGIKPQAKIVPFRGEYYELDEATQHLCRNLIYPVPDPSFPFLGVHFTRLIHGGVECGPNAVLAFAREGYFKSTVNPSELIETLTYPGFRKMAMKHYKMGMGEMHRSVSKAAFVRALQRLVPEIRAEHLKPIDAGVRAQAVLPDGTLLDDFSFEEKGRAVHVVNAVSPAATACLAIADHVADRLAAHF